MDQTLHMFPRERCNLTLLRWQQGIAELRIRVILLKENCPRCCDVVFQDLQATQEGEQAISVCTGKGGSENSPVIMQTWIFYAFVSNLL